jgi:hypothetical protein
MAQQAGSERTALPHGERSVGRELAVAAGVAGGLGGAVMAVWVTLSAALEELDPLAPLKWMAATVLGPEALEGGAGSAALGGALHLGVSVAVAWLFAAMVPRDYLFGSVALLGVFYALVVLAVMTSLVLPALNPGLQQHMSSLAGAWVLAHAAFGITLGLTPWARRLAAGATERRRSGPTRTRGRLPRGPRKHAPA